MLFIDNLKPMKIYRKQMFLPTLEDDKKKKSAIFLLTPNYESSKSIMLSPLFINKLRFSSYYIEKDLTYFISSKVMSKVDDVTETYVHNYSEVDFYQSLCEMSAAERNALKDSQFGLPKKRKYPLNDKSHVKSAIKFFNYVDPEDEAELARNLNRAINKYFDKDNRPKVGEKNRFSKYYKGAKNESATTSDILDNKSDSWESLNEATEEHIPTSLSTFTMVKLDSPEGIACYEYRNGNEHVATLSVSDHNNAEYGNRSIVQLGVNPKYHELGLEEELISQAVHWLKGNSIRLKRTDPLIDKFEKFGFGVKSADFFDDYVTLYYQED